MAAPVYKDMHWGGFCVKIWFWYDQKMGTYFFHSRA